MLTVYSLPTCGKCNIIKSKLTAKGVQFNICEDIPKMQSLGIVGVPCLELDNGTILRNFAEINSYTNKL